MPRVTIHIGGRERINPIISKATLLLPTDALVWIGATCISGTATAMRALADAYDADPEGFNQREHAERAADV